MLATDSACTGDMPCLVGERQLGQLAVIELMHALIVALRVLIISGIVVLHDATANLWTQNCAHHINGTRTIQLLNIGSKTRFHSRAEFACNEIIRHTGIERHKLTWITLSFLCQGK